MKVEGDPILAKVANRRPPLRAVRGSESAPHAQDHPEREALIDDAIALFSPRYGRMIGREEARQMIERLTAFFSLLAEWDQRARGGSVEGELAA